MFDAIRAAEEAIVTRGELIDLLASRQGNLGKQDVEFAVKAILQKMTDTLAAGGRVEIRGFKSFNLHAREARMGRNPKTGEAVALPARHVPCFRAGKELRERVNASNTA